MRHYQTNASRKPPARVFMVEHIATGYYTMVATIAKEYLLSTFINRLNGILTWNERRKFTNYAIVWFAREYGPFKAEDFRVINVSGRLESAANARVFAANEATKRGTDKLLNAHVVPGTEWKLEHHAMRVLKIVRKKDIDKNNPVTGLEQMGRLTIDTFPIGDKSHLWQLMALTKDNVGNAVALTPNPDDAFKVCRTAGRAAVGMLAIKHEGDIFSTHYIHFAPSIAELMSSMEVEMKHVLAKGNA